MIKSKFINYWVSLLIIFFSLNLYASEITIHNPIVIKEAKHDTSIPFRDMQTKSNLPHTPIKSALGNEIILSRSSESLINLSGFQGLGVGLGNYSVKSAASDPSFSVGRNQVVHWVNSDIAVFDKNTGQVLNGFPKPGNSLWSGFGGPCENSNIGKQTAKYDHGSKKWILSQSAYTDIQGPYYQCVAVSTSEDATGSYYRYAFQMNSFINYARLGVWPDAYYLTLVLNGPNQHGPVACALERSKMITGSAATIQCLALAPTFTGPILPVDLNGSQLPAAGNPAYIIGLNPPYNIMIGKFHVDFATPANTNLSLFPLPVAQYKRACDNVNGQDCAIQPNTTNRLNVLSDRLLSEFTYRQFKSYGSMVATHTVEGPAPESAPAIRWYELRVYPNTPNHNPVVYQQATIAPDSMNRFMGAISIDRFTNIAIGYTVSSSLIYPSLEMAYHAYNDQNNHTFIQPVVTGMGSQVDNVKDWGSHSSMTVDPVDECTFWYSNQYLKTTGSYNWSTFIVKFKLAACQ